MKRLILASALLGLAGAVGTANGGTLTDLTIWNALTPGNNNMSPAQIALPATNPLFTGADLISNARGTVTGGINFSNLAGGTTVQAFLNTDSPALVPGTFTCAACATTTISQGGFAQASLFRLGFTVAVTSSFSVTHDDGVALFTSGTTATASDLFNPLDANPTSMATTETVMLAPGSYDLWYVEANGLPAILQEHETAVPEPASLTVIGSALVGLGWLTRRRRKAA